MQKRLQEKIALVTGIGGGIGKGCALRFASEGATVIGCDIDAAMAATTRDEAKAQGLTIDVVAPCDLTREADVKRYVDYAGERYGRIDALVNAAAAAPHTASLAEMDYESQWSPTLSGEVDVVFLACHHAWPYLCKSPNASIVNFASVAAFRASTVFGMTAHCAAKGAVLAMTRQLAVEGAPTIRANTISPGLIMTPATERAFADDDKARERMFARIPLKRFGTPDDIAWCAVFLASDESNWITGANFPVDGGILMC
ncbi:SDR family NAD(P)-dependent oxidoreductase [Trinickia fusca]|uniref:SDR family oxidoreductase n=1 Tax=Trinickia fusca TaxID=2419777 RepID=A0A494XCW5_9BURK|nr:SDR family oxidoreductase [Trinickia fusca]RKP45984.1 SDR family oxidoreductase [Trinickia fusca]